MFGSLPASTFDVLISHDLFFLPLCHSLPGFSSHARSLARSRLSAVARSFPAAHSRQWRRQTIATIATVIGTCKKEEDPAQHLATPTSLHPLTNMYARQVLCYRRDNLTYSSAATAQVRTRPWQATQWSRAGTMHQSVRSFDYRALLNFRSC